ERPGEEGADDDVVGPGAVSEKSHQDAAEDGGREEAGENIEAEDGGGEGAGEGDVAQRVAGEDLCPEDHEVADQAARDADEAAGDERVTHELVREHQAASSARRAAVRRWRSSTRASRTTM